MKKKMHITILGLIAVLVLVLALAGCGKITEIAEDQDQQESSTAESAAVETEESGDQPETAAPETEDASAMNSDGTYVYQIDGHDWAIGIKIEDLIHDGQINAGELHMALGFDRTGDLRDTNNTVIAKSVGFLAGAKQGPYDTVTLMGNANYPEARLFYNFMSESSDHVITVVANTRSFRVTLDQLVVAIYGCEQYRDGELHDDVYGDLLDNYVSSETYYLIP